jgi:hypothetical protein
VSGFSGISENFIGMFRKSFKALPQEQKDNRRFFAALRMTAAADAGVNNQLC